MKRSDFHYDLPEELIAHYPSAERSGSRLLVLYGDSGEVEHRSFVDLPDYLRAGDLLVFNDTRVVPARLFGRKASGGRVEVLVERFLDDDTVLAQVRASKSPAVGASIYLAADANAEPGEDTAEVVARRDAFFELRFSRPVMALLDELGHMPLPPYIDRPDETTDRERYQTVYARQPGAVAAPTAGLHFTGDLIRTCAERGVDTAFVTLHVGAGTFQPVRVQDITEHEMHPEYLEVSAEVCDKVRAARARGGRVVAVGTTSVRSLETASQSGELRPYTGESDIFIYPGYRFRCVDVLLTNFHLPESTLIMLVSAFAGRERVLAAYREAVRQHYRFFSYGDAMLVFP